MEKLFEFIKPLMSFNPEELKMISDVFIPMEVPAKTILLNAGYTERYIYFISKGIVKGYKNIDGKIYIEHLEEEQNFTSSFDSFNSETPSLFTFETITACKLLKISKPDLELLGSSINKWNKLVERITNDYLSYKMKRIGAFQTQSAKERYIQFLNESPNLALNVSIDNIASFLGIEPQSLSRIRKQIT